MYIVDTNILMETADFQELLKKFESKIKIPVEVLTELDNLKTLDGEKGYKARRAIRNIEKAPEHSFEYIYKKKFNYSKIKKEISTDNAIINYLKEKRFQNATLVTNDLSMKIKAQAIGIKTITHKEEADTLKRPIPDEISLSVDKYLEFCENPGQNIKLINGNYLIIKDSENAELRAIWRKTSNNNWEEIPHNARIENYLFKLKPKDNYQRCAIDSLYRDNFTVITGPAGTGKTLLSFAFVLMKMKKEASKVHIFVNPTKARGAEDLGFYPGSRDEKLLQTFVGDVLKNKIGDITEVERLMAEDMINIYPISDIRGIEVRNGDIMYITEAQNLSIDMIKLAIQRCAEGAKIIIEGDPFAQVDKGSYEGNRNGLKRIIKVFEGFESFSHIYLPNIYRSEIAKRAEML